MAAQKTKEEVSEAEIPKCEKCGGPMYKRLLIVHAESETPTRDFINILQCNLCRFYIEYVEPVIVEPVPEPIYKIIAKAYELGVEYEKKSLGCAQTSLAAIFDALGIWSEDAFKAATGLSNGLGSKGVETCGALIGAAMAISFIFGREHEDFDDMFRVLKSGALVKRLYNQFLREYGVVHCSDMQKALLGVTWNYWELTDMDDSFRTQMIETCSGIVGNTAKMATTIILKNGFTPKSRKR
jgi:C_GCAxxG_C_C family probable redox protein